MPKRPLETTTLKRVAEAQEVLDDDEDMASGTRLRMSNALMKIFESLKNTPDSGAPLRRSDVISLVLENQTRRLLVRDLPQLMQSFLREACLTRAGALHGASLKLFFPMDWDDRWTNEQRTTVEDIKAHVARVLVERHGLVEADFDDEILQHSNSARLTIPGTTEEIRDHARDIAEYEFTLAALTRGCIDQDDGRPWRITGDMILSSFGMSDEDFESICEGSHSQDVVSVKLAHNFCKKLCEMEREVDKIRESPSELENSFDETDSGITERLKAAPRFVLLIADPGSGDILDDLTSMW